MLPKREKKKTPRNLSSHLLPVIFFTSSYSSNASRYLPDCITLNSPSPFSRRGLPGLFGKQDSIDGLGALPFLRLGFLIKTNYQRIMLYDPVSAAFPRVETPSKPPRSPFSLDSGPLHPQTLTSPLSTDFGPF